MKKYIFLFAILLSAQVQAQGYGWARYFVKNGKTISLAVSTDTLSIANLKISGTISGALTSADSTGNNLQTKSENDALYGRLAAQNAWTASNTFAATSGIVFLPYGSGAGTTTNLRFRELSANGTNYLGWKAPDNIAANVVYVMPRPRTVGMHLVYGSADSTYWAFDPIEFEVDTANTLAADTSWIWQNKTGQTLTVDSIHVAAGADDYAISIVKKNYTGGGGALIDAVTASTNGTNLFYITETTITSATITAGQRVGFKRPTTTADFVYVRIHYH